MAPVAAAPTLPLSSDVFFSLLTAAFLPAEIPQNLLFYVVDLWGNDEVGAGASRLGASGASSSICPWWRRPLPASPAATCSAATDLKGVQREDGATEPLTGAVVVQEVDRSVVADLVLALLAASTMPWSFR
jgi:hypothetical protein